MKDPLDDQPDPAINATAHVPPEAAPALELRLFGPFEARIHGTPAPNPRTRRGAWLLGLLCLRDGRPVARNWLAGVLWPESVEDRALYNLRRSLTDVRDLLGPEAWRLEGAGARSLRLDLSGLACDVLQFDACVAAGDPALLERAVELYRGALLEGCSDDWVLPERAAREEAYLSALERLAAARLAADAPGAALGLLRRAISLDPLRESVHRRLMEAHAAAGDEAAALQVYRNLRLLLHREINAAPSPETVALFERLQERGGKRQPGAPGAVPTGNRSAPSGLPRPLSSLIGREAEASEVRSRLSSGRLVTLTGAGGVGKTRLALKVAQEAAQQFPGGVRFADFSPLTDPMLVPQAVATALGVRVEAGRAPVENLAQYLEPTALLLVLDNCEHVVEAVAALAHALLSACPRLKILATSQQSLDVTGEMAWRVPSLPVPPDSESSGDSERKFLEYESVRLFLDRASRAGCDLAPDPETLAAVSRICRDLDGIPLAIELAAARLKVMSPKQLARRLDDCIGVLAAGSRTAPARHQTLRAALAWSHGLLSADERTLFHRLAVFTGGWTLEAAEAVCAGSSETEAAGAPVDKVVLQPARILELLSQLVDKSLVIHEVADGIGRYRFLEMVRQYARERLAESGEELSLQRCHGRYFSNWAESMRQHVYGVRQSDTLQRMEREDANLRAALDWHAVHGTVDEHLALVAALAPFWYIRSCSAEGWRRAAEALERAGPDASPCLRAAVLHGCGSFASDQDEISAARGYFEQALPLYRELGLKSGEVSSLSALGGIAKGQGDLPAAERLYQEAIRLNGELDDPIRDLVIHYNLGTLYHGAGDYPRARFHFEAGLRLGHQTGDTGGQAQSLLGLGNVAEEQGDFNQAEHYYSRALPLAEEIGSRTLMGWCLHSQGRAAFRKGDLPAAEAHLRDAIDTLLPVGNRPRVLRCLVILCAVAAAQGKFEQAATVLGAVDVWRRAGECVELLPERQETERATEAARCGLGNERFQAAWSKGGTLSFNQAVALALT